MSRLSRQKAKPPAANRNALRASGSRKPVTSRKPATKANQEFDIDSWEPSLLARMRKAMREPKKS